MTVKEIAELCGVETHTVRNWINREDFLRENFTLRNAIKEKLNKGSPEHPSDYDLDETLAIIGEGGENKALASLLAENAANKAALTVREPGFADRELISALADRLNRLEGFLEISFTPRERQLRELKAWLHGCLEITGDKADHADVYDLYYSYKSTIENPLSKDEFPHAVMLELPELKVKRNRYYTDIIGCRKKH